jgi:hypothetical protein
MASLPWRLWYGTCKRELESSTAPLRRVRSGPACCFGSHTPYPVPFCDTWCLAGVKRMGYLGTTLLAGRNLNLVRRRPEITASVSMAFVHGKGLSLSARQYARLMALWAMVTALSGVAIPLKHRRPGASAPLIVAAISVLGVIASVSTKEIAPVRDRLTPYVTAHRWRPWFLYWVHGGPRPKAARFLETTGGHNLY